VLCSISSTGLFVHRNPDSIVAKQFVLPLCESAFEISSCGLSFQGPSSFLWNCCPAILSFERLSFCEVVFRKTIAVRGGYAAESLCSRVVVRWSHFMTELLSCEIVVM